MSDVISLRKTDEGPYIAEHYETGIVDCNDSEIMAVFNLGKLVARQADFEHPPKYLELRDRRVQAQALRDAAKRWGSRGPDEVTRFLLALADELDPPAKEEKS